MAWAVVAPDPRERFQLPAAAVEALCAGPARSGMAGGVLVLCHGDGPGRPLGIDRRGRCYLPAWLRRPAVLVATDSAAGVVLVVDAIVLESISEQLARASRV